MPLPIARLINEHKLDPESLKAAFNRKTIEKRPKVKKLVEQIRDTVQAGIKRNRADYRLYKAMDWACDTAFNQVSYTQLRGLISGQPDDKKVLEAITSWGLTHMLPDVIGTDGKACCDQLGNKKKAISLPIFFNIFVPICMAYITMRWAKLFNDRNLIPHYKYEPIQFTKENRFRCEVLTQIVARQSSQFDYPADTKQTILQTLMYGFCINFPREAWYVEKQEDESGKEQIVREGVRFNMPHPSRMYYDLYHRLSSLNSNSGCEYAGYWELCRYKDIYDNELYWNKDDISYGNGVLGWFDLPNSTFLQEVFPCTLTFPSTSNLGAGGVGQLDRQNEAAGFYGQGDYNAATLKTEHFQKLIPAEYGLGTYKYPMWMRFVFANDCAVIWAEPLAYDRIPTYTYDADFNRSKFRSLTLEIMPFQDHISNLLTQWILSVKENLLNPVFYDRDKIPPVHLQALENLGQKMLNGRLFIPFSATQNLAMHTDIREAFFSPQLTHHPTGELAVLIAGVLNMLDRIMQLSPQEIGQPASHEQTAEETRVIAENTSTRVTFTSDGIDAGDYAKKVLLYDANMAYADESITVGITSALAATEEEFNKLLKSVEFTIADKTTYDPQNPELMHTVTGNKSALKIEAFASTRDNKSRINLPSIADAMSKIFLAIAGNPVLIQAVGPVQLVELLNQVIMASGVPQEFRLRGKKIDPALEPQAQAQEVAQMMKQFAGQVQELVAQKQQETLAAAGQQTQAVVGQAMQAIAQKAQEQAAQGAQAAAAGMAQMAPALQAAQQEAQVAGQKLVEHEQEIQSLIQAVSQLEEAVRQGQQQLVPMGG